MENRNNLEQIIANIIWKTLVLPGDAHVAISRTSFVFAAVLEIFKCWSGYSLLRYKDFQTGNHVFSNSVSHVAPSTVLCTKATGKYLLNQNGILISFFENLLNLIFALVALKMERYFPVSSLYSFLLVSTRFFVNSGMWNRQIGCLRYEVVFQIPL